MVNKIPTYTINSGGKFAIVASRSNPASAQIMAVSCRETLEACGVESDNIYLVDCPTDLVLPGLLREVARCGFYAAVVGIAVVSRRSGALRALQIGMATSDFAVPVIPVLVRDCLEESAMAHAAAEAGRSAVEMANLGEMLGELSMATSAELFGNLEDDTTDGEALAPLPVAADQRPSSARSKGQTKRSGRQAAKPARRTSGAKRKAGK